MTLDLFVKLIMSILVLGSIITLNFAIFRIPIFEHHKTITIMTIVLGVLNFYIRFIVQFPVFPIIVLMTYIVLMMVLKKYPLFYSFIVCSIGLLVSYLTDGLVTIIFTQFKIIDFEVMLQNWYGYLVVSSCIFVTNIIILIILKISNIGFSFIIKRFKTKQALKGSNFIWAGLIVIGVTVLQLTIFQIHILLLHIYMLLAISIIILLVLFIAYIQNLKSIKDRFGR